LGTPEAAAKKKPITADLGAGVYILKSSAGSSEYLRLRN
jgi:hypothetical protein